MEASRATSKFAQMFQDGDLRKDYYFGAMSQSGNTLSKKQIIQLITSAVSESVSYI